MTKVKLLATASIAALTLTFATAAYADEKNSWGAVGNAGDTYVKVKNNNNGGEGGASGNVSGAGIGGSGAGGAALGGGASNTVNANAGNKYTSVKAQNKQRNESGSYSNGGPVHSESIQLIGLGGGGAKIDTSGGTNKQYGGDASGEAKSQANPDNTTKIYANGGDGDSGKVEAENEANRKAYGGSSDASGANSTQNTGTQASGPAVGGAGGSGNIASATTTGGPAGNTSNGGGTSGVQNANGGAVSGGVMGFAAMSSAAGAFGFNMNTGNIAQRNAANAIAADVGTINNFTASVPGG